MSLAVLLCTNITNINSVKLKCRNIALVSVVIKEFQVLLDNWLFEFLCFSMATIMLVTLNTHSLVQHSSSNM